MLTNFGTGPLAGPPRVAFYNNPRIRGAIYQIVLLAALVVLAWIFAVNAKANLEARGFASGFGFLQRTAGFGVVQSLISYSETDTYGRVFVVGLLNTLLVAGVGIVLATLLGFVIGLARLSPNWLVARLGGGYVELIRNLPLLFQILFWYLAVLGTLPAPRDSYSLFGQIFLNNRGIIVPAPVPHEGAIYVLAAFLLALVCAVTLRASAVRRQEATGQRFPALWVGLGLIVGAPLVAFVVLGFPIGLESPQLRGFNFVGGVRLIPEFAALLIALSTYTAASC